MTYRFFLAIVVFAVAGLSARADIIIIRGAEKPLTANVKSEDAKVVVVTVPKVKGDQSIPAADIIEIVNDSSTFGTVGLIGGPYKSAQAAEKDAEAADAVGRKKALSLAISKYDETRKTMKTDSPLQNLAARNIEFKIAMLMLKGATDQAGTDKAVARLLEFRAKHANSWQIHQVMPLIAQIQLDSKDFKGAAQTFQEMSEMASLAPDIRADAELKVVEVSVREGKIDEATRKLDALEKKAASTPSLLSRVKMARAEIYVGQKQFDKALPLLQDVVKTSNDKLIKAMAHNHLGESHFKAGKYQEALWEFLWVDAVFNTDRNQHAKALYYLWKTFQQLNNEERAQECREMLINDRQFQGTEWQREATKAVK